MKIYNTKEEARKAAEAWAINKIREGFRVEISTGNECIDVRYDGNCTSLTSEYFKFKPERVAPAKRSAIRIRNGMVFYSMGEFLGNGKLKISNTSDCLRPHTSTKDYTPVDIIPAGQFAKALELLEQWKDDYKGDCEWSRGTIALLDEIKAGGE